MRISDWSSDVCSSDLDRNRDRKRAVPPVSVIATIARTAMSSDRNIAAIAIAWSARCMSRDALPKSMSASNCFSAPWQMREIGRANIGSPDTHAHIVCRLTLDTKKQHRKLYITLYIQ